jgi:hypothetical protein
MLAGLTPRHSANARQFVTSLHHEWLKLSPQLMAQAYTLALTIEEVIRAAGIAVHGRGRRSEANAKPAMSGEVSLVADPEHRTALPASSDGLTSCGRNHVVRDLSQRLERARRRGGRALRMM